MKVPIPNPRKFHYIMIRIAVVGFVSGNDEYELMFQPKKGSNIMYFLWFELRLLSKGKAGKRDNSRCEFWPQIEIRQTTSWQLHEKFFLRCCAILYHVRGYKHTTTSCFRYFPGCGNHVINLPVTFPTAVRKRASYMYNLYS